MQSYDTIHSTPPRQSTVKLRVLAIHGEQTRFWVESNSWKCTLVPEKHLFNRRLRPDLREGAPCPKCPAGAATLELRWHLVDISSFNRNGMCACEFFTFSLGKQLASMSLADQGMGRLRCHHIEAARQFAIDLALGLHEAENGGPEREGP